MIPLVPEVPRARTARFTAFFLVLELIDGRELHVPLKWSPQLRDASPEKLARFELSGDGSIVCWPGLGEAVSVADLLYPPSVAVVFR